MPTFPPLGTKHCVHSRTYAVGALLYCVWCDSVVPAKNAEWWANVVRGRTYRAKQRAIRQRLGIPR